MDFGGNDRIGRDSFWICQHIQVGTLLECLGKVVMAQFMKLNAIL